MKKSNMETQKVESQKNDLDQINKLKTKQLIYKMKFARGVSIPEYGSVKNLINEIYEQGALSSTSNALCSALRIINDEFIPSRMYIYYIEIGDTQNQKNIIEILEILKSQGVCSEKLFPYKSGRISYFSKPPEICDKDALNNRISNYLLYNIGDLNSIKYAITRKVGVIITIGIYKSFLNVKEDGVVYLPNPKTYEDHNDTDDPFMGMQTLLICGYYDKPSLFTCLNSSGLNFGKNGFCYLPYNYVNNSKLTYGVCSIEK